VQLLTLLCILSYDADDDASLASFSLMNPLASGSVAATSQSQVASLNLQAKHRNRDSDNESEEIAVGELHQRSDDDEEGLKEEEHHFSKKQVTRMTVAKKMTDSKQRRERSRARPSRRPLPRRRRPDVSPAQTLLCAHLLYFFFHVIFLSMVIPDLCESNENSTKSNDEFLAF
jgi:hypothetical protein